MAPTTVDEASVNVKTKTTDIDHIVLSDRMVVVVAVVVVARAIVVAVKPVGVKPDLDDGSIGGGLKRAHGHGAVWYMVWCGMVWTRQRSKGIRRPRRPRAGKRPGLEP